MEPVLVSVCFYVYVFAICEIGRTFLPRYFDPILVLEFFATLALCTCTFENSSVYHYYGKLAYFFTLAIIGWCKSKTKRGALANPATLFEKWFVFKEMPHKRFVTLLTINLVGGYFGYRLAKLFWTIELTDFHYKRLRTYECNTDLNVSLMMGIFLELIATFLCEIVSLTASKRYPSEFARIISCLTSAAITVAGRDLTGMYFNPILAFGSNFGCRGLSAFRFFLVYWLGPILGQILATNTQKYVQI